MSIEIQPVETIGGGDEDKTSKRRLDRTVTADQIRQLSALKPWRWILSIALQWVVIGIAFWVAYQWEYWWVFIAMGLVIATRQHALGVLMHEAVHYRALSNRQIGDAISDALCALPLGVSTNVYRHFHFLHHSNVGTPLDPDWTSVIGDEDWKWPKPVTATISVFLRDLTGLNMRMLARYINQWSPYPRMLWGTRSELLSKPRLRTQDLVLTVFFALSLIASIALIPGFWFYYLVLWLLPQFTVLTAIFRLRALAEHYCLPGHHELNTTRTVVPNIFDVIAVCPCGINYHLEHHLFPSVPFYNLPKLHRLLLMQDEYRQHSAISNGYIFGRQSLMTELVGRYIPYPATKQPSR